MHITKWKLSQYFVTINGSVINPFALCGNILAEHLCAPESKLKIISQTIALNSKTVDQEKHNRIATTS